MPPAFILIQDRTLHEIPSCITYSFLVRIICIHALHIRPEFPPRNIAIPAPSRQSHEPLIHSHHSENVKYSYNNLNKIKR
ncbi:hypothetical protein CsSME_00050328 [Camellia sinensis var. sinensis]